MLPGDLALVRRLAFEKGLPYQTYIKVLLREALVRQTRGSVRALNRRIPMGELSVTQEHVLSATAHHCQLPGEGERVCCRLLHMPFPKSVRAPKSRSVSNYEMIPG
jgi:hypothetical protein